MADSILPPNSSKLERDIEELGGKKRIDAVENPVGTLWNPESVPAKILPYLAWALSVDTWEDDWSDEIKRLVIASSVEVHRKKGTVGAVKKAIAATGIDVEFFEWFENGGTPHTFSITAWSNDNRNTDGTTRLLPKAHAETISGVNATKPVRAHFELMFGSRIPSDIGLIADGNATGRINEKNEIVPYPNRSNSTAGGKFDSFVDARVSDINEIIPYTNRSDSSVGGKYDPLVATRINDTNEVVPYPNSSSSNAGGKFNPLVVARLSDSNEIVPYLSRSNSVVGTGYDSFVTSRAGENIEVTAYANTTNADIGMLNYLPVIARVNINMEIL
ncbi:MAG: phage tail protein I [Proteobacteria bacterium]|nr:phage tail protein I [Pseudomonadota bacterium]